MDSSPESSSSWSPFEFQPSAPPPHLFDSDDLLLRLDVLKDTKEDSGDLLATDGDLTKTLKTATRTKEKRYVSTAALAYDQAAFSMRWKTMVLNFPVERVEESLQGLLDWGGAAGAGLSPVMALKEKHSIRKRKSKPAAARKSELSNLVELEVLADELLE